MVAASYMIWKHNAAFRIYVRRETGFASAFWTRMLAARSVWSESETVVLHLLLFWIAAHPAHGICGTMAHP